MAQETATLAAYVADLKFDDIPVQVLERAKILTLDFSSYNLEDDSLAPDGGPFYYPRRGIQELPDALSAPCTCAISRSRWTGLRMTS